MKRIIEWDAYGDYRIIAEGENVKVNDDYEVLEEIEYNNIKIVDVKHRKLYVVPFYQR